MLMIWFVIDVLYVIWNDSLMFVVQEIRLSLFELLVLRYVVFVFLIGVCVVCCGCVVVGGFELIVLLFVFS